MIWCLSLWATVTVSGFHIAVGLLKTPLSGRPFENTPYLDYAATEFIIPAEQLLPENAYQLSVEHAILDTTITEGVPGFATFATTTFLDIMTLGRATDEAACPEILKNFDAGQTNLRQPR